MYICIYVCVGVRDITRKLRCLTAKRGRGRRGSGYMAGPTLGAMKSQFAESGKWWEIRGEKRDRIGLLLGAHATNSWHVVAPKCDMFIGASGGSQRRDNSSKNKWLQKLRQQQQQYKTLLGQQLSPQLALACILQILVEPTPTRPTQHFISDSTPPWTPKENPQHHRPLLALNSCVCWLCCRCALSVANFI